MKDYIPTEEDFNAIFDALASHEREKLTRLAVEKCLAKAKDLTDEQAFSVAFSKKIESEVAAETEPERKRIVESTVLLYAKMVRFRDAVREHRLNGEIDSLIK